MISIQVCTLKLNASTGMMDENDLTERLAKVQSMKLVCC